MCKHEAFLANVEVHRLIDSGGFMADIKINCSQCGMPFRFKGLSVGVNTNGASCSVGGDEARIAIAPIDAKDGPLDSHIAFGLMQQD